jgi:hypothetical protein
VAFFGNFVLAGFGSIDIISLGLVWDTEQQIRTIKGEDITEDNIFELAYGESDQTTLRN